MVFSSLVPAISGAYAATTPLFTVNLIVPNSNAVRRQHGAIIADSMQAVGIDARVYFLNFADVVSREFFENAYFANGSVDWSQVGLDFNHGGNDVSFIGWGATSPTPDSSFSNIRGTLNDWAPNGNNYYLYNSSVVNAAIKDMYAQPTFAAQQADLFKIQAQLLNDTPFAVVYYTNWIVGRDPLIKDYGGTNTWSELAFPDVQHYSGVSTLNFAEAGNVFPAGNLNPLPVSASNSFYALFQYSPVFSSTMEIDPRNNGYYLALANSITTDSSGLNWTINFKPNNFQDGVAVTADDFVFTLQSTFDPTSGAVGSGSIVSALGSRGSFTYLNGTTKVIDQTAPGDTPVNWAIKAVSANTFQYSLSQLYPFMNLTYTVLSPLPKHYFEQMPYSAWSTSGYSTAQSYTFHYDTAKYGGNGTATFGGPFGNGAYIYTGFDTASSTAHEVAWEGYWNATGLESMGQFSVKNYNVVWINGGQAAVTALLGGTVNQIDTNYALSSFQTQIAAGGKNVVTGPELGYQEMGINNFNPIWGTGKATPNGVTDPANAAKYAADVRKAFSLLIPRQLIVQNLLLNAGTPGITPWGPAYGPWFNSATKADAYDPVLAKQYLALAGYGTSGISGPITVIPITPYQITGGNVSGGTVSFGNVSLPAGNIFGLPINLTGTFASPITGSPYPNQLLVLEQSLNGLNYSTAGATVTDSGGNYWFLFYPAAPGTVWYRWQFTGYFVPPGTFGGTGTVGNYTQLIANGTLPAVLPPQTGPVNNITTITIAQVLAGLAQSLSNNFASSAASTNAGLAQLAASTNALTASLTTQINTAINSTSQQFTTSLTSVSNQLSGQISSMQSTLSGQITAQKNDLTSQINTATYVAYGGIIIAVIALLAALFLSRRKS
jgi:ABC-type transport system substrate-binding protein